MGDAQPIRLLSNIFAARRFYIPHPCRSLSPIELIERTFTGQPRNLFGAKRIRHVNERNPPNLVTNVKVVTIVVDVGLTPSHYPHKEKLMKHINRTLTAAVLAGSLALGGTAVASAQIPAPATLEVDGLVYEKQHDGSYLHRNDLGDTKMTAEEAQFVWEQQQAQQNPEENGQDQENQPPAEGDDPAGENQEDPAQGNEGDNPSNEDPSSSESDFDKKQLAWLALPAALVIGGVTWYLAKDGKTYVKSQEAAQKDAPTAEEKAASEQILQENKDEVIAQGGQLADSTAAQTPAQAPAQSRGISAETGSNTVARALAALAFAAMIAAGAAVARRKLVF